MDWKNWYGQNVHTTQTCQNSNVIFHRYSKKKKKNLKMCIESQKILNNQSNPEKEKHSQRHHNSWFQTILHSYSNENSMILA